RGGAPRKSSRAVRFVPEPNRYLEWSRWGGRGPPALVRPYMSCHGSEGVRKLQGGHPIKAIRQSDCVHGSRGTGRHAADGSDAVVTTDHCQVTIRDRLRTI